MLKTYLAAAAGFVAMVVTAAGYAAHVDLGPSAPAAAQAAVQGRAG